MNVAEELRRAGGKLSERLAEEPIPDVPRGAGRWVVAVSVGVATLLTVGGLLLFTRGSVNAPVGTDTRPATTTSVATTTSQPPTTTTEPTVATSTVPPTTDTAPPVAGPEPFVPEVAIDGGRAALALVFPDGSIAQIEWPATLDLISEGVTPYAWAYIPHVTARDFFIRHGEVADALAPFGPESLLAEYPDGKGGIVQFWRVSDNPDVDYLAFQFDDWSVLVYDYRGAAGDGRMSEEDRALWATNFHGTATADGFLRLSTDYPLNLAPAGGYPSPLSMTLSSPSGAADLVPEDCAPGFVSPIDDDDFGHWCDESGRISVRVTGSREFQQQVRDGLVVRAVHLAGVTAPDGNGSYQGLADAMTSSRDLWAANGPAAYRLRASGNIGIGAVDMELVVLDGDVDVGRGSFPDEPLTVDRLFDMISAAVERGDDSISARFHPQLGYPTAIRGDESAAIDDEWALEIALEMTAS